MIGSLLAKLDDFKSDGDWSGNETDDQLRRYLLRASSMAEQLAGLPDGGLRRATARVELPPVSYQDSYVLPLKSRVIESVSEVIQTYSTYTDAEFDAEEVGVLTENEDFVIESVELATLRRVNLKWYRRVPRCIRVTYTAGLADPSRIRVALSAGTWTESTKTLTEVGAFANYSYTAGDVIIIESGTGATKGVYPIASRTSDDAIVLSDSLSTSGGDLATGDIVSAYSSMTDPPQDLQEGVIRQAMLLHNTRDTAGLEKIDMGDAGGSFTTRATKAHPQLVAAVQRYRRML